MSTTHLGDASARLWALNSKGHVYAPAVLKHPGADTEGAIFDATPTLPRRADRHSFHEWLVFVMRDLRHLDTAAAADLADWIVYLDVQGKADKTVYEYMRLVARLVVMFPDKPFREFTDTDLERFLASTPRQSRHITRSIIAQWFKWGKMKRRIDTDPMDYVAEIQAARRRPKDIFSAAEVALLEGLPSPDGQLWTLLFGSGMRRHEARACKLEHVDQTRERVAILGKGSKGAIVPLETHVVAAVAELELLEGLNRGDHLWYTKPGGRHYRRRDPIGDTTFERWYRNGIEAAGARYLSPHQTRHTYGHMMREKGFDLEERRLLMRHENIRTTQHYYGTLTVEDVARKVAAL